MYWSSAIDIEGAFLFGAAISTLRPLSSTDFIPCPNGFVHPETYRLYEALECECIPIVENAYRYYDRLFPNNPFLKVDKWQEAKLLIKGWKREQISKKRDGCKN